MSSFSPVVFLLLPSMSSSKTYQNHRSLKRKFPSIQISHIWSMEAAVCNTTSYFLWNKIHLIHTLKLISCFLSFKSSLIWFQRVTTKCYSMLIEKLTPFLFCWFSVKKCISFLIFLWMSDSWNPDKFYVEFYIQDIINLLLPPTFLPRNMGRFKSSKLPLKSFTWD